MFRSSDRNHKCVVNRLRCGANRRHRFGNNRLRAHNHNRNQRRREGRRNNSQSRRSLTVRLKANQHRAAAVKAKDPKSLNHF